MVATKVKSEFKFRRSEAAPVAEESMLPGRDLGALARPAGDAMGADVVDNYGEGSVKKKRGQAASDTVTILVNTRPKQVARGSIDFEKLVRLAFDAPAGGDGVAYTITYRKGSPEKPEGSIVKKGSAPVTEGMVFNVTNTTQS